jgi:hypothetical protein
MNSIPLDLSMGQHASCQVGQQWATLHQGRLGLHFFDRHFLVLKETEAKRLRPLVRKHRAG